MLIWNIQTAPCVLKTRYANQQQRHVDINKVIYYISWKITPVNHTSSFLFFVPVISLFYNILISALTLYDP